MERVGPELAPADRRTLEPFVQSLEARLRAVTEAGIPDSVVHGDFHRGNHRGSPGCVTLLDWGDSGVGHPLPDEPAFLDAIPATHVAEIRERWHARRRTSAPGSEPERAAALLAPVAAARRALIYQKFLDNIEPSEHPYHASDPVQWLARSADLVRQRR